MEWTFGDDFFAEAEDDVDIGLFETISAPSVNMDALSGNRSLRPPS
jgi:hypothetical protein